MAKKNYYQIHTNKKPKKAKYSDPLSKQQKQKIRDCYELLMRMSSELNAHITHVNFNHN